MRKVAGLSVLVLAFLLGAEAHGDEGYKPSRWKAGPTDAQIAAAWPAAAKARGERGKATLECTITSKADVKDCKVLRESPAGAGFGQAALSLIPRFRALAAQDNSRPVESTTQFTIHFPAEPGQMVDTGNPDVSLPEPVQAPSEDDLYAVWPTAPRANSVEGSAQLLCVIDSVGLLSNCSVIHESKPGLGFGEAALQVTDKFRFLPGMREGMSVNMRMPVAVDFTCGRRCTAFSAPKNFTGSLLSVPWLETPTAAEIAAATPAALPSNVEGFVMLFCQLRSDGGVRSCKANREEPAGLGLTAAAISLSARFKGLSKRDDGRSVEGAGVQIPISFSNKPGTPALARAPTDEQFVTAYPKEAMAAGAPDARVVMRCKIVAEGRLQECGTVSEEPQGLGFGAAALSLSSAFAMTRWGENGRPTVGGFVRVPIQFIGRDTGPAPKLAEAQVAPMMISNPDWANKPSAADVSSFYPLKAYRLEKSGRVILRCLVNLDGTLKNCLVVSETPPDLEFGLAALAMSKLFRMNPSQIEGHPVGGYAVTIPVTFGMR